MPTEAKEAPVSDIQACAAGCADWLRAEGFVNEDNPFGATGADVYFAFHRKIEHFPLACSVFEVFAWLWVDVLPAIDGRREAERQQIAARKPAPEIPDPALTADLFFGSHEHDFAKQLRGIWAPIAHLEPSVELLAKRHHERAVLARGVDTSKGLVAAFRICAYAGAKLRNLVEPSISSRGDFPIPHSVQEWNEARVRLEAQLHDARMEDPEIARVLPGAGGDREVYRRRRRWQHR